MYLLASMLPSTMNKDFLLVSDNAINGMMTCHQALSETIIVAITFMNTL